MSAFAKLPAPPYDVVCVSSKRTDGDNGYGDMADQMEDLARKQPGFLGVESTRGANGFGITNSYRADEASIKARKTVVDHLAAQRLGRECWHEHYAVRMAKVERACGFV